MIYKGRETNTKNDRKQFKLCTFSKEIPRIE